MKPYEVLRSVAAVVMLLKLLRFSRRLMMEPDLVKFVKRQVGLMLMRLPSVRAKLRSEKDKTFVDVQKKFVPGMSSPTTRLPEQGMKREELMQLMDKRAETDTGESDKGKTTGAVYHGGKEHCDFIGSFYAKWAYTNTLHPTGHPALRQMDSEVVQMVINLYNGPGGSCGCNTTGGTESIIVAMKSYRDQGIARGIVEPNIVVCRTAHAAFWKAGQYLNFAVRDAGTLPETQQVDVRHMARLIDGNTVAIVGSACTFPHGAIDPIEEMSRLSLRRGIGLHVDCCLGGFIYPFAEKAGFKVPVVDFRVPGVTTISCDPHKYGFTPKGESVLMFRTHELRCFAYSQCVDWSGGIYATPTIVGSRAGGPVAATWAAMCSFGVEGYVETTRQIMGATMKIAEGIEKMADVEVVGKPELCVVAFRAKPGSGLNSYAIADCMQHRSEWELASCQNPSCIHLALTLPTSRNADLFLSDLQAAVSALRESSDGDFASTAGLYGMASSLPTNFVEAAVGAYLDAMLDPVES
jgi:sphinganine-1-phosphate aldolase